MNYNILIVLVMNVFTLTYSYGQVLQGADTTSANRGAAVGAGDSTSKKTPSNKKDIISYKGSIQFTTNYITGNDILFGLNGLYNSINLQNTVSIDNVPVTFGITGVNNEGAVNNTYYTYYIHFNSAELAKQLEQIIINKIKQEAKKKYDSIYNKTLKPIEDSVKKFEAIKSLINDKETIQQRQKNQFIIDSLQKAKASGQPIDSAKLDSLKKTQNKYEALENEFYKLLSMKARSLNYQSQLNDAMQPYESSLNKANNASSSLNEESVVKDLQNSNMLSGWQKELLAVKNVTIGESTLNYSPFTITGILFNGLSAEVAPDGFYVAFSIGDELNTVPVINPYANNTLPFKRDIDFIRVGVGEPTKTHLLFSYTNIKDGSINSNSNSTAFPEHNSIYDLDAQDYLTKTIFVKAEVAHSQLTIGNTPVVADDSSKSSNLSSNSAVSGEINASIPQTKSSLDFHISNVGRQFVSLGDAYLINGAITYGGFFTQNIFKSALKLKIGVEQVTTNLGTSAYPLNMSRTSLDCGFSYNLGKYGSLQLQYLPNSIITNPSANEAGQVSQQNMLTMTDNVAFNVGKLKLTTTVNANNYYYSTNNLGETQTQYTNRLIYYYVNQNLMLKSGNYYTILANWSNTNWVDGQVQQYIVQSSYSFTAFKKVNLSFGTNLSRQIYNPLALGGLGSIQLPVFKVSHLSLSINYRNAIDTLSSLRGQLYLLSSLFINW